MIHVQHGTKPPGFATTPEAWAYVKNRGRTFIAAFMRRIDFDGSQACAGMDDLYLAEHQFTPEELAVMDATCTRCRFLPACTDYALSHEQHNYYAGMTSRNRAEARRMRGVILVNRDAPDQYGLIPRGYAL